MSVLTVASTALTGIRANLERLEDAAARISKTAPHGDLAGDLVDVRIARYGVEANTAVVRAADELTGTLLDVLA